MQKLSCLIAAALSAGCANLAEMGMTPEQHAARAANKDANVSCVTYDTLPTDVAALQVNIDAGVVPRGSKFEVRCGQNSVTLTNIGAIQAP